MFKHNWMLKSDISLVPVGVLRKTKRALSIFMALILLSSSVTSFIILDVHAEDSVLESFNLTHTHLGSAAVSGGCYTINVKCGGGINQNAVIGTINNVCNSGSWHVSNGGNYCSNNHYSNPEGYAHPANCPKVTGTHQGITGYTYSCAVCGQGYGGSNPGSCTKHVSWGLSCGLTENQAIANVSVTKHRVGSTYDLIPSVSGVHAKCTTLSYSWNTGSTGTCSVTANATYTLTVSYKDNNVSKTSVHNYVVSDYDTEPPVISSVTPSTLARTKDDIILTVNATDNYGVSQYSIDGSTWQAGSAFTVTSNGSYTLYARDLVTNTSSGYVVSVSNIDKAAPNISISYSNSSWTKDDVTITPSGLDLASAGGTEGTVTYTIQNSGGDFIPFIITENCTGTVYATDDVGNVNSIPFEVGNIDKTLPIINFTPSITAPTNGDVIMTLTGSDAQSGLATLCYSIDGVTWSSSYSSPATVNGTKTSYVKDAVGNIASATYEVSNIDKDNPVIDSVAFSSVLPCNTNVVVTVNAHDIGLGLSATPYSFNSDAYKGGNTYVVTTNGTYDFEVKDLAGNVQTGSFEVSNLDFIKPVISSVVASTTLPTNQDVILTVTASDVGFGLDASAYRLQGYGDWQESNMLSVDCNASYTVEVRDKAGNIESASIDVTNIDKVPPTAGHVLDITDITRTDVTAALTILDDVGISQVETYDGEIITNASFTSITNYTFTVNGSYDFTITDTSGNITVHTIEITNIDKTKAEIDTITFSTLQPSNSYIDVLVTAHDIGLGLESNAYNFNGEGYSNSNTYRVNSNGIYSLEIIDLAGNVTTDSFTVSNLDFDVPIIDGIDRTMLPINTDLEVVVSAHDVGVADLNDTAYRLDIGTYSSTVSIGNWQASDTFSIEENGDYVIHIRDGAGNEAYQELNVSNIDKMLPIATSSVNDTNPTKDSILATLDLSDNVSIKSLELPDGTMLNDDLDLADYIEDITSEFTDRGYLAPSDATFSSSLHVPYIATVNGSYDFTITDTAGNITVHTLVVNNIDKLPAEITTIKSVPEWTPNGYDLLVTFKDDIMLRNISIDGIAYNLESGEYPENTEIISYNGSDISEIEVTISVSENGIHDLSATDFSSNLTESSIEIKNIDRVSPKLVYNLSTGSMTNKNVIASITASDSYGDVDYILFPDGSRSYNSNTNYSMPENDNYQFKVYDKAGNFYELTINISNIDKSVPSVSWTLEEGILEWSNSSVTLLVNASDDSKIKSMLLIGSSKTFTGTNGKIEVTENGTYILEVTDLAGNVYAKKIVIFNIDTSAPNISTYLRNIYWSNNSNVLVISALDNQSGTAYYSMDGLNWQSSNEFVVEYASAYSVYAKDAVGNISSVIVNFPLVTAKKSALTTISMNGIESALQQLEDDEISESDSTADSSLWDSYLSYGDTSYNKGNETDSLDSKEEDAESVETVKSDTNVEIIAKKLYGVVSDVTETVIVVVKQTYPALILLFTLTLGLLSLFILTNGVKVYTLIGRKWKYVGLVKCKPTSSGYSIKLTRKLVRGLSDNNCKIRFSSRYARLHKSSDISINYGDIAITSNLQRNVEFSLFKA